MNFRPPDRHQQALAILAIATAVIGVGLFAGGLSLRLPLELSSDDYLLLSIVKSFAVLAAVGAYFLVFTAVIQILALERAVAGVEVVRGPLLWLYWQMVFLALIFLANAYIVIFGAQQTPTLE